jgi:hypothetical protein
MTLGLPGRARTETAAAIAFCRDSLSQLNRHLDFRKQIDLEIYNIALAARIPRFATA